VKLRLWLIWFVCATVTMTSWAVDPMAPLPAKALAAVSPPSAESGLKTGPVKWNTALTAGLTHDNNIGLSQTNREVAYITSISPQVTASMGNLTSGGGTGLMLNYQPTFLIFSDYTDNNAVDELASLQAQWSGAKLTLGLGQEYTLTHGAVIEVGQRVRQDTYTTDLLAKYAFSDKTSLEVGPRLTIQDNDQYLNTQDWGVDSFVNHQITSKVTGGIGGTFGYFSVQNSADQRYARGLARVMYELAEKIKLTVAGGVEYREYTGSEPSTVTPVFGIAGTYQPLERTTLTLEAHRREEAAIVTNDQNYVTMGFSAEVRQLFWQQYFVSLNGGYDNRYYSSTKPGAAANRTDNYFYVRPSAGATFAKYWSVMVFYEYQANDSSGIDHSFIDSQVGIEGSWRY
jgi:hypothetical protein